jgi:hypothetical protein
VTIVRFPDQTMVTARGLRREKAAVSPPEYGLYLLARDPGPMPWRSQWIRWRDFWQPSDRITAAEAIIRAFRCAQSGARVEVACRGGHGRTGTALACMAVLSGVAGADAVEWVRNHYHPRAIETPWQRRWIQLFSDEYCS